MEREEHVSTFPAMKAVDARTLNVGNTIYGRESTFKGSFILFKHSVEVTAIDDVALKGINANGSPWAMRLQGRAIVLTEHKEGESPMLWILQGHYGDDHGWEDLTASEIRGEVESDMTAYRQSEQGRYRIIKRRQREGE